MRVIKISNPIRPAPPPFCDNSHNATMKRLLFTACKIDQRLIPQHHYSILSKTQIKKKKKKVMERTGAPMKMKTFCRS